MEFQDKIVVITGGCQGIGCAIAEAFRKEGATICIIDKVDNPYFVGDVGKQEDLEAFVEKVIAEHGKIDVLVNNAMKTCGGIDACGYADFVYAQQVGVVAPYYLTKLFLPYFAAGASILNISSSRDRMSQPNTESYTAAKGGIAALTHSLAVSLSGKVRVNSISPGWIDTTGATFAGADNTQHPAGRVGNPADIANMAVYLASGKAGFITGENICIDGGMTKQMIYHGDEGWSNG